MGTVDIIGRNRSPSILEVGPHGQSSMVVVGAHCVSWRLWEESVRIQKSDQTGDWTQAFWTYTRCSNHWLSSLVGFNPTMNFMYLPPQIMVTSHPQMTTQSTIDHQGQPNDDSATTTWVRLKSSDRLHNPSLTITTNWPRPHVLPGLNMTLGIMSTGLGLILVPSFLPTLLFFGIHYTSFPSVWS